MALNISRMRRRFETQFEARDDGGYFYRRNWKGAGIPVTPEERETFVTQYVYRLYLILGAMVVAVSMLLGGLILRTGKGTAAQVPPFEIFGGMVAISLVATGLFQWVYLSPARQLKGRSPVGRELTRDEVRAIAFRRISYAQIAVIALIGGLATTRHQPTWGPGGHGWPFLGGFMVLVAVVQAFRKWHFEQEHPDDL
jgi:hypothetical protein